MKTCRRTCIHIRGNTLLKIKGRVCSGNWFYIFYKTPKSLCPPCFWLSVYLLWFGYFSLITLRLLIIISCYSSSADCSVTDWSHDIWYNRFSLCPPSTDCPDSPSCGRGLLSVLAASPHRPPLGGVWLFPPEPGLFCVPDGRSLFGLQ